MLMSDRILLNDDDDVGDYKWPSRSASATEQRSRRAQPLRARCHATPSGDGLS